MALVRATFVSATDSSVVVGRDGGISINGRTYSPQRSDNDLVYVVALLEEKLPESLGKNPSPTSTEKKIAALFQKVNFVDVDQRPFITPVAKLAALAPVVDTLEKAGHKTPRNWEKISGNEPVYSPNNDTLQTHTLELVAPLGVYFETISPEYFGQINTAYEHNKPYRRPDLIKPPGTMVFSAFENPAIRDANYFAWFMRGEFKSNIDRIASIDQNAANALRDIYNIHKSYFRFEVSQNNSPVQPKIIH